MTTYDVVPAELDAFALQATSLAWDYHELGQLAATAELPDGAVGDVLNSGNLLSAYRGFLAGLVRELDGAALAASYFADATSQAAAHYRRTDAQGAGYFRTLLGLDRPVPDLLGGDLPVTGLPAAAGTAGDPLAELGRPRGILDTGDSGATGAGDE